MKVLFSGSKINLLLIILAFALTFKLFIDGFVEINKVGCSFKSVNLHKRFSGYMNVDDIEMASVARNVLNGKNFVTDISYDRPKFRPQAEWPTAFRPKLNIWVHIIGLETYARFHPDYHYSQPVPDDYFRDFSAVIFILKNILFVISLFYFYRLASLFMSSAYALISTILYCIYPSIMLYVGMINIFECIIMPCLVIVFSMHLCNRRAGKKFSLPQIIFLTFTIPVIGFLKMQVFLIVIFMYLVMLADVVRNPKFISRYFMAYMPANVLIGIFTCYILISNYQAFGRFIISTQSSVNLFHGHNPYARGSWNPLIWKQDSVELQPVLVKNIDKLSGNEYDETLFYKEWALSWIKQHPVDELKLCIKKTAIYFLPYNSNCWRINPFTLAVHLFFFCFLISFIARGMHGIEYFYLLAPAVAVFLVNIIFFVEYRWRYLADPFMLLLACIFVFDFINKRWGTKLSAS